MAESKSWNLYRELQGSKWCALSYTLTLAFSVQSVTHCALSQVDSPIFWNYWFFFLFFYYSAVLSWGLPWSLYIKLQTTYSLPPPVPYFLGALVDPSYSALCPPPHIMYHFLRHNIIVFVKFDSLLTPAGKNGSLKDGGRGEILCLFCLLLCPKFQGILSSNTILTSHSNEFWGNLLWSMRTFVWF